MTSSPATPAPPLIPWSRALPEFLARQTSPATRRSYASTLARIGEHLDVSAPLASLDGHTLAAALSTAYDDAAPATWNRAAATLRAFLAWCADREWADDAAVYRLTRLARRRRVPLDHSRAIDRDTLAAHLGDQRVPLRERTLWRMLYETAARAEEVLRLDVADLDQANRAARTRRKGGDLDVLHYATGTARLLPRLLAGRQSGPLFLSSLPPRRDATPALADLDPSTGHARLSYRQAAALFTEHTGSTLHQLRHSALTHLAEDGVPTALLLAKSRHGSVRSLQRYARPSPEAVAQMTADHDPYRRR